jgi:asparagine synthase (glutamine-hydrolysing)
VCGIIGIINASDRLGKRELGILNDTMYHRGPDGKGLFWYGGTGIAMRRLAIIDLETGDQPLFSEDKQIVVVMNGEIYNYPALRRNLIASGHQFSTHSDTEVLVHGYEQYGIDGLLARIDGMFAFAIWDRRQGKMFLARDRFGEKPLYVARDGDTVLFGSQLLSVVAGLPELPPVSPQALQYYWALHFVPGSGTIFEGAQRLRPSEACEIDVCTGRMVRSWQYWKVQECERPLCAKELADLVAQAVQSRLIADVPVGVFLSGGLDSSLLASLAAQQVPGTHTFSVGFDSPRHDESGHAWEVASYIGSTHHHFMFEVNEFRSLIPQVIATMDEPVGDQAMLPLYALAREAGRHVKVVLSGEGADELFGGYSYYVPFARAGGGNVAGPSTSTNDATKAPLFSRQEQTASGFPLVLPSLVRHRLSAPATGPRPSWESEVEDMLAATQGPLRRAQLCDIATWLSEDLLMKADKMTMAASLESRSPYLAPALAQAALNLPTEAKIAGNTGKVLLREAATPFLPETIIHRAKHGWILPMRRWLERDLHEDFIESIRSCPEPMIDKAYLESIVAGGRGSGAELVGERALYALLVLVKWLGHAREKIADVRAALRSRGRRPLRRKAGA